MTYKLPLATTSHAGHIEVGDGLTVTNGVLSATTGLLNYGFFTNGTQTNPVADAVNLMSLNNTGPSNGIAVVGSTDITVTNAGTYTKMFTVIVSKTSGGTTSISFWLRYNGVDVDGSRQDLELTNTLALTFVSGNFTLDLAANSYIQLCWSSADTTAVISALPADVTPTRPTGASAKVTLTRIS